jgi:hypothetical protein
MAESVDEIFEEKNRAANAVARRDQFETVQGGNSAA